MTIDHRASGTYTHNLPGHVPFYKALATAMPAGLERVGTTFLSFHPFRDETKQFRRGDVYGVELFYSFDDENKPITLVAFHYQLG